MFENRYSLLYPIVKKLIMITAWVILACCGISVMGALVETYAFFALASAETEEGFGLFLAIGAASSIVMQIANETMVILVALMSPWCCYVLLGRSGNGLIRALSLVCMWSAIFILFEKISRWCIGAVYFSDTSLFSLFASFLCGCMIFASVPFYWAASIRLRCCLYASGVLIVLTAVLDTPGTWLFHAVSTILTGIAMAYPSFLLARTAPMIVSLPSEDD